jgi:hypothetical protein
MAKEPGRMAACNLGEKDRGQPAAAVDCQRISLAEGIEILD